MTELNIKECVQVSQMGRKEKGFLSRRKSRCKETGDETAQGVFQDVVHVRAPPGPSRCPLRWVITMALQTGLPASALLSGPCET